MFFFSYMRLEYERANINDNDDDDDKKYNFVQVRDVNFLVSYNVKYVFVSYKHLYFSVMLCDHVKLENIKNIYIQIKLYLILLKCLGS